MLTAAQVAPLLGLRPRAVYDLAARGILACYRLGADRGAVRCMCRIRAGSGRNPPTPTHVATPAGPCPLAGWAMPNVKLLPLL